MQGIRKELTGYMKEERNKGKSFKMIFDHLFIVDKKFFLDQNGRFKELSEENGNYVQ